MCGIHGVINGKNKPELNTDDFIKSGFVANMLRGVDSSGIGVVDASGGEVAKLPLAGMYLPGHRNASTLITAARKASTASMCHVRAATVGNITYDNAHPFHLVSESGDEIIGVHNGTLTNWRIKKLANQYNVDSEWAMSRILEEGADAFEEITGAFAMVWWLSSDPEHVYMARNKERPLIVAYTKDGNMLYASEAGMLHWLAERHRIEIVGNLKQLEEDHLFKFNIDDPTKFTKGHLPKAKVVYSPTYGSGSRRADYDDDWGAGYSSSVTPTTVDKLNAIFSAIKEEDKKPDTTSMSDICTNDEVQDAYTLGVLGHAGVFEAMGTDDRNNSVYGTFTSNESKEEMNAVMRNAPDDIDWSTGGRWTVRIAGIVDNGNDFIVVTSHPIEQEEAA